MYPAWHVFGAGVSTLGPVRLTGSRLHQILASDNNVYVLWQNYTEDRILFQKNTDYGSSFGRPIDLTKECTSAPQMGASGSFVYIACIHTHVTQTGLKGQLEFMRSVDGRSTFENAVVITDGMPNLLDIKQILTDANMVHIVWTDSPSGQLEGFTVASKDHGKSFGKIVNLSDQGNFGDSYLAVAGNNNLYAAMMGKCKADNGGGCTAPLVRKSDNYGDTFESAVPINDTLESGFATDQRIDVSGKNHVFAIWQYNGYYVGRIFFAKSDDGGKTFGNMMHFENSGQGGHPVVMAKGKNVYLFWQTTVVNGTKKDIMFARSSDDGDTFSKPANLSNVSGYSDNYYLSRQVAENGDNVYLTWNDWSGGEASSSDILFRRSMDGGTTFDNPTKLNSDGKSAATRASSPQIAVSGNDVYVAWHTTEKDGGVFLRASSNLGKSFGDEVSLNKNGSEIIKATSVVGTFSYS
jgi:hypothetical protein